MVTHLFWSWPIYLRFRINLSIIFLLAIRAVSLPLASLVSLTKCRFPTYWDHWRAAKLSASRRAVNRRNTIGTPFPLHSILVCVRYLWKCLIAISNNHVCILEASVLTLGMSEERAVDRTQAKSPNSCIVGYIADELSGRILPSRWIADWARSALPYLQRRALLHCLR